MKENITHDMKKEDGKVQVLLCTEAYSMGADSPNIREIHHVGPPNTVESKCLYRN